MGELIGDLELPGIIEKIGLMMTGTLLDKIALGAPIHE